jgi:hypothetical protein
MAAQYCHQLTFQLYGLVDGHERHFKARSMASTRLIFGETREIQKAL